MVLRMACELVVPITSSLWPFGGFFFSSTNSACSTELVKLQHMARKRVKKKQVRPSRNLFYCDFLATSALIFPLLNVPLAKGHIVQQALNVVDNDHAERRLVSILKGLVDAVDLGNLAVAYHMIRADHLDQREVGRLGQGSGQRRLAAACESARRKGV